jgi:drug/metabolite transporter (DMT)-like permease
VPAPVPDRSALLPYLGFTACAAIWGSTFLVIRLGNQALDPLWAATLRLGLASVALLGLTAALGRSMPTGRGLQAAVLYGLGEFGLGFSLLYWGETLVPSGIAAVLFATIPLWTTTMATGLGVEAFDARRTVGAVVAVAGVATVFAGELTRAVPLVGLAAVLAAAASASLGSVLLKRGPAIDVIPVNAVATGVGALVTLTASVLAGEAQVLPRTAAAWWPVVYLTVAGSLVAFVVYAWLIDVWPVTNANMVSVTVPVTGLVLGAAVAGESFSGLALVGAGLVVVGLVVVLRVRPDEGEGAASPAA